MISTQPETSESESEDEVEPKPDPEKKKVCDTYESMNNHPKKSKHQKQIDCLDLTYSSDEDEDEEESLTPKKKKKKTSLSFTMQPKKEKEKKSALLIRHEGEMKPVSLSLPPKKEKKPLPSMAPNGPHGYGHVPLLLPPQFTHHHHSLSQPQMIHMPPASTGLMMNENGCNGMGMGDYTNNRYSNNNNASIMHGYTNNSSIMHGYNSQLKYHAAQGYNNNLSMMQNPGVAFGSNSNLNLMQNPSSGHFNTSNPSMMQNMNQSSRQPQFVIRDYERTCIGAHNEKWLRMWREAYNIICLNGGSIIGGHNGDPALAQWLNSQKKKFWSLSDLKQELISMLGLP